MYSFPWVILAHPSGCNPEFPCFLQISKYVSTLFPNTESYNQEALHRYSSRYSELSFFDVIVLNILMTSTAPGNCKANGIEAVEMKSHFPGFPSVKADTGGRQKM